MTFPPAFLQGLPDFCSFALWKDDWLVARPSGNGRALFSSMQAESTWTFDLLYGAGINAGGASGSLFFQANNGVDGSNHNVTAFSANGAVVLWGTRWDGAMPSGSKGSARLNGAVVASNPAEASIPAATLPPTLTLGEIGAYTNGAWTTSAGSIAALVLCRKAAYDANIERLEGWAAHNWGQQALLPTGHPYKNAPPMI
jgi:hypothetical protein